MDDNKSDRIPTNEDIIDELTKDLTDTQLTTEPGETETSSIPHDFDDSDSDSGKNKEIDDSDDEGLNAAEQELTDEQKEMRRREAIELKDRGNDEFKLGNHLESVKIYSQGLRLCPLKYPAERAILYSNRAASKIKLEKKQSAIEDCTKAIKLNDKYVRAYLRRARLYEETDKLDESLEDYTKVVELDPGNKDALHAKHRLPPLINERNEKLKTEMLGKLKDLGNMILKPFGLSTNNFQMQQDPNTGGYSVSFNQNHKA